MAPRRIEQELLSSLCAVSFFPSFQKMITHSSCQREHSRPKKHQPIKWAVTGVEIVNISETGWI